MKIKLFILFIILALAVVVSAEELANIRYPVEELGGCKDKASCKAYCDKPANTDACFAFAEKNGIMSKQEIKVAKGFLGGGIDGPGGCKTKDACEEYCDDISRIDECISFAEENNLIPPEQLEEAKKVQSAIARGVKPPPCGNKKSCDAYCEDPEHMEECITFGIEAGFMQGKEAEEAQKMLQAVKRGVKPPPCRGKEECDEYCGSPDNMEVCMNFAMEAGFMSEQEKADSQKMLQALKKGIKPPPCRGKEECDVYCQQEDHFEECTNFAVAAGFMNEKDAEMARKTGGKGPGGCKSKEECEAFCNNPDNQETCFNFGKENGMIPEEDLRKMEEGKQQMKQSLERAPVEVLDCLDGEMGAEMVEKMKNGFMPPQNIGEKMQTCFQKMGSPPGSDFRPGPDVENPGGQMMPPQAGPGGCKSPEECRNFCDSNPEQCKNSGPGGEGQFAPGNSGPATPCQDEQCREVRDKMGPPEPCQGENCQPPPQDMMQFQPPQPGENFTPCQGSDCPQIPSPPPDFSTNNPLQQFAPETGPDMRDIEPMMPLSGENASPPTLSTEPGTGGDFAPGEQGPLAPPIEQAPPTENPPPVQNESPPTSFIINTDSLVGSLIYAAFKALFGL